MSRAVRMSFDLFERWCSFHSLDHSTSLPLQSGMVMSGWNITTGILMYERGKLCGKKQASASFGNAFASAEKNHTCWHPLHCASCASTVILRAQEHGGTMMDYGAMPLEFSPDSSSCRFCTLRGDHAHAHIPTSYATPELRWRTRGFVSKRTHPTPKKEIR
nr:hypothetical protein CFP56_54972 [Quercus suber]POF24050.1 hypothetical protein CFP56_54986 [Quercus suber]